MIEPGRMLSIIALDSSFGAGRPGISAVVMMMSWFLTCSATSSACFFL